MQTCNQSSSNCYTDKKTKQKKNKKKKNVLPNLFLGVARITQTTHVRNMRKKNIYNKVSII